MNQKTRNIRILIAAVLAALFAASGLTCVATATGLDLGRGALAIIAMAGAVAAALCALAAGSIPGAVVAAALFAVGAGAWSLANLAGLRAMGEFFALWRGGEADMARAVLGGRTFLTVAAAAFGAAFFLLLYRRELTSLAVTLLLAMLVASHAASETASLAACVPGLIAAAVAFAFTGGLQRDAASARALVPAAVAVAVALMFLPAGRLTWQPMEDLAARVRSVFEQYFNFTRERIAFSISEEGYNHGGEIDGQAVAMLGGPAQPDDTPVMRVEADSDLLLRGTIRATYTGYSWVDLTPKNRYLYFDLTHRAVRDRVFDVDFSAPRGAFREANASVELLDSGTSTIFVPARLSRFSMDLSTAVYYNSSGEMFLARDVQPGDAYSLAVRVPVYGEALRRAVIQGEGANDERYADILAAHTDLPEGIESGLYALTIELTRDSECAYDRAEAIANYLRGNMRYRLDVEYPPVGRDFASYFVLDSREGYCSYFATAMAVMGRIAGLPTRYVEGYFARPGEGGQTVLTGQDAHAWAEVYFRGLGWVPFDATNGGPGSRGQDQSGDGADSGASGDAGDSDEPNATPEPDGGEGRDGQSDEPDDPNDPESDGDDSPGEPSDTPMPEPPRPDDTPEPPQDDPSGQEEWDFTKDAPRRHGWLIALGIILLLLVIALAVLWVRRRLKRTSPVYLCGQTKSAQKASMIAYRANLTLLNHMGQAPVSGEAPEAFAQRVSKQLDNPDYAAFVRAVALSRYGRRPLKKEDIQAGLRAYLVFEKGMRRSERLRFGLTRVFRGIGDFESIP